MNRFFDFMQLEASNKDVVMTYSFWCTSGNYVFLTNLDKLNIR